MEYTDSKTGAKGSMQKRRKTQVDLSTMMYGKVPPQAKDLEESILGAIMLERTAIDLVSEWLKPEAFYVEAHQRIFRAMMELTNISQPIDIHTVCEKLRSNEDLEMCGGNYYVMRLTNSVVSSANIESHAKIVLQKFIQREVIRVGGELIADGYEDSTDVFELLEKADKDFLSVTNALATKRYDRIDTWIVRTIQEIEAIRHSPERLSGVTSGYTIIDNLTHGWQNTDLITIAARPSVGKTAFALNLARNAVVNDIKVTPTAFFSMEMSSGQLVKRLFSSESEIPLEKIQRGRIDEPDMKKLYATAVQRLGPVPLFIDDTPGLNIFQLRAKCRRLKKKEDIGLVIIDYLQLMSGTERHNGRNREQEISEISRGLKGLAKELNIPIIALSQLSRAVETRGGEKMPQLSDLRESGAIEQDSDVVMFLYRPEYYSIMRDNKGESSPGETHIKFAKNRNGKLDTVKLRANLWCQKFVPMENDFSKPGGGVDFKKAAANDKEKPDEKLSGPTYVKPGEAIDDLPF